MSNCTGSYHEMFNRKLLQESFDRKKKKQFAINRMTGGGAKEYLKNEHVFCMVRGGVRTPIKITMTGRAARDKNRINIIHFSSGKHSRLIEWKLVKVEK